MVIDNLSHFGGNLNKHENPQQELLIETIVFVIVCFSDNINYQLKLYPEDGERTDICHTTIM